MRLDDVLAAIVALGLIACIGVGLASSLDDSCSSDSQCMAQCERDGGTDCHLMFEGEEDES